MEKEIYAPPKSEIDSGNNKTPPVLLYTPIQVGVGTYIGGPFAAMYFLKGNFDVLGKYDLSRKVIMLGVVFSAILFAVMPFIPEELPNNVVPMLYLIPVILIVKKHQLTKQEIQSSKIYECQSSWKVFGLSLLWMILFLVITAGIIFGFESVGLISFS